MSELRKFLGFFFRVLVVFLSAVASYFVVQNQATIVSFKTLVIGATAFFGAFFAFGFDRLSNMLTVAKKRRSEHFNSLVKIERLLNRILSQLDKNIQLAKDDTEALRSMKLLVWNLPPIPFKHDLSDDLMNIDYINDYFSFTIDIETLNHDLAVIMSMYNESKGLFLSKIVSPEDHKDNVAFTVKRLSELIKFMDSKIVNTKEMLAKARIILKEREQTVFLLGARPKKHYQKNIKELEREELLTLENEIEEIKKSSQDEIDKLGGIGT